MAYNVIRVGLDSKLMQTDPKLNCKSSSLGLWVWFSWIQIQPQIKPSFSSALFFSSFDRRNERRLGEMKRQAAVTNCSGNDRQSIEVVVGACEWAGLLVFVVPRKMAK